jgi:MFS family permease
LIHPLRRSAELLSTEPEVLALSFARMADALGNSLLIVILPLYIAEQPSLWLDIPNEAQVGLVISLYGFLFAFAQPFAGALTDRAGRRKPFILAGLALMALATLGFMFAHRYVWIVVLRCLQGLGVAMIIPSVLALISAVTEKRTRGNAMGVYSTLRMVGFATGPLLGGLLHVTLGFNAAFLTGAAFLAVAYSLVQFTVHEREEPAESAGEDIPAGANGTPAPAPAPAKRVRVSKMPNRTNLALLFSTVIMASSLSMISALENEFNERLAQTALGFGLAFSALTVARLFVQIPLGRLSDRVGRKKLIVGGLTALAPLTVLFGYVGTTLQLVGVRLAQGVASAAIAAPAFALAADLAQKGGEGREMSFVTMGFGLGLGVGPLIAGGLGGYVSFESPFLVVGGFSLLAALSVAVFAEESIKPHEWSLSDDPNP